MLDVSNCHQEIVKDLNDIKETRTNNTKTSGTAFTFVRSATCFSVSHIGAKCTSDTYI